MKKQLRNGSKQSMDGEEKNNLNNMSFRLKGGQRKLISEQSGFESNEPPSKFFLSELYEPLSRYPPSKP